METVNDNRNVAFSWTVSEIVLSYGKCTIFSLTFTEPWKVRFVKIDFSQGKYPDLYGVTYRSKFSQGIFPIAKSIFMSGIDKQGSLLFSMDGPAY